MFYSYLIYQILIWTVPFFNQQSQISHCSYKLASWETSELTNYKLQWLKINQLIDFHFTLYISSFALLKVSRLFMICLLLNLIQMFVIFS